MSIKKLRSQNRKRANNLAERKKSIGLVQANCSRWVLADDYDEAMKAMDKASRKYADKAAKKYRDEFS